ncbi:MAG: heme biosynthesis HemY N-terminal domain-containing protein [Pseudomonadota bacterium]
MRVLFISLTILTITAAITAFVFLKPGYVLLAVGNYSVEMSLLAFTIISLTILTAFYVSIRIVIHLWRIPLRLSLLHKSQQRQRQQRNLSSGFTQLAQGNWSQAEKLLVNSADQHDSPLISYLSAAYAAHEQGKFIQRDEYLEKAHQYAPSQELAISLTRAKLLIDQGQTDQALATLSRLHHLLPRHAHVLKLLSKLYLKINDWSSLRQILPAMRKVKEFNENRVNSIELAVFKGQLLNGAQNNDIKLVQQAWKALPFKLRQQQKIIYLYARSLRKLEQHQQAEAVIRNALNDIWNEPLAAEYGLLTHADPTVQLSHAEVWLKQHDQSAMLLLSLARICRRAKLWGKARYYYELSLAMEPQVETYLDLAILLDQLEDVECAQECYQKGLRLAVEGIAEPLRSRAEKYTERYRETTLNGLATGQEVFSS